MSRSTPSPSPSPRKPSGSNRMLRMVAVALLIVAAYWYQEAFLGGGARFEQPTLSGDLGAPILSGVEEAPPAAPDAGSPAGSGRPLPQPQQSPAVSTRKTKANGYDRLDGCRLVDHRDNDGDSFRVRHGDREFELRLYYVDTPEKYLSDRYEDQRRRVAEQGRDFGGLSPEQTVEVGIAAKLFTAKLLDGKAFAVHTKWERVFDSNRVYGFVALPDAGGELIEKLVENGLSRIHTKGETTPDGRTYRDYKARLEALERAARDAERGAWGLN